MPIKYTPRQNRLPGYNYKQTGHYYATICTHNRIEWLGKIENNQIRLNPYGQIVKQQLHWIEKQYPYVKLDEYIIMPNHIHIITNIVGVDRCVDPLPNNKISDDYKINHSGRTRRSAPTIYAIVQWFKIMPTNKYIQNVKNNNWPPFAKHIWQRNFYDHIIRNDKSLDRIREYIINNPRTWDNDVENPDRTGNIEPELIKAQQG